SPFYSPRLTNPGCPPPITFIFSSPPTRLTNLPATFCALRSSNVPPFLNNVAFPGADILEVLNTNYGDPQPPASETDVYKLFLLGGETELQRAREVQPTFVTAWLGNNDVLGAILDTSANAGSATDVTPPATFTTRFNAFMDSVDSFGTIQGGLLIGVVQVAAVPYASQGRAYFAAQASIPTLTFPPDPNATAPPFGTAVSRDGVHPSTSTQRLLAQMLRDSINAHYNAAIPPIP